MLSRLGLERDCEMIGVIIKSFNKTGIITMRNLQLKLSFQQNCFSFL
jgi:hypothetical protein